MSYQKIQIFGLRCSGTNFLEKWLVNNFKEVEIVNHFAFKHLWNSQFLRPVNSDDSIDIMVIVRNPYDWIRSMQREPHHCPDLLGKSLENFVKTPLKAYPGSSWNCKISSIRDEVKSMELLEYYDNILQMRNSKHKIFCNLIKNKRAILINYELLRDNPDQLANKISSEFGYTPHQELVEIKTFKKTSQIYKQKKVARIPQSIISFINKEIMWDQENYMGYDISDYRWDTYLDIDHIKFQIKTYYAQIQYILLGREKYMKKIESNESLI